MVTTTPSMQFQFDIVPAAIGVSIYVLCQILLRVLVPRSRKVQELKASTSKASKLAGDACVAESNELHEEPEPVPEPEVEMEAAPRTAPSARTSKRTLAWRLLALLLVLGRVLLPLWSQWPGGLALQRPAPQQAAPTTEASGGVAPEPAEEGPPSEEWEHAAAVPGSTEPAFTVSLVRHASDEQEDYVRSAYYGTILLGTPATEMTFVFDTGSGHLVAPSYYCHSETCKAHMRYRRSASETSRDINMVGESWQSGPRECATITFGTGQITGVYVEDVVCMGHVANTSEQLSTSRPECMTLRFLAATQMSEDPFKIFPFDGILGLGLSALSQTSKFNFMEVLAESLHGVDRRTRHTFGIFLANNDYEESEISFGGWADLHLQEELSWSPIHDPEQGHWIIPIRGIRVDNQRLDFCDDGNCTGAVDTGTSLVAVPTAAFRELYFLLRHQPPLAGHCQGFGPLLHFELEDFTITLGPRDYGQVKATKSDWSPNKGLFEGEAKEGRRDLMCTPMLMTLDMEAPLGPKLFVMGEPVLRKYYSVFDGYQQRVGFGKARHIKMPTRNELLEMVPRIEPRSRQRLPTMFDVFRWRKALL